MQERPPRPGRRSFGLSLLLVFSQQIENDSHSHPNMLQSAPPRATPLGEPARSWQMIDRSRHHSCETTVVSRHGSRVEESGSVASPRCGQAFHMDSFRVPSSSRSTATTTRRHVSPRRSSDHLLSLSSEEQRESRSKNPKGPVIDGCQCESHLAEHRIATFVAPSSGQTQAWVLSGA